MSKFFTFSKVQTCHGAKIFFSTIAWVVIINTFYPHMLFNLIVLVICALQMPETQISKPVIMVLL
ncbi:MAG: hypothetical protein A2516_06435 [Alphaproteobacteria bacterium RIFOXYD12_FULL_60_8]|nr:MAG: hypothetical protein A2516_06435 [Alphaproteobacteria bacterium RIFOXYD12_FULL_60_8]